MLSVDITYPFESLHKALCALPLLCSQATCFNCHSLFGPVLLNSALAPGCEVAREIIWKDNLFIAPIGFL